MIRFFRISLLIVIACIFVGGVMAGEARSIAAGKFVFNLDGVECGFIRSTEGGDSDPVVIEEPSTSYYVKKHLGPVQYSDVSLQTGIGEFPQVNAWIEQTLEGKHIRKDGSIVALDSKHEQRLTRQFYQALLTEISFPACDSSAKDPGFMTLTFTPEISKWLPGSGVVAPNPPRVHKPWQRSDFLLSIPGLDCSKVAKIDGLTIKQSVVRDDVGEQRDPPFSPGKLEFPNLVVTLPAGAADTWLAWYKEFVIDGKNDDSKEKTGTLVFLSPNRETELCAITLYHLGIFGLNADDQSNDNDDKIRHVKVKMYCERMTVCFPTDKSKDPQAPTVNGMLVNPE